MSVILRSSSTINMVAIEALSTQDPIFKTLSDLPVARLRGSQISAKPRQSPRPSVLRGLRIVTRPRVVVEGVIGVWVNDLFVDLVVLLHGGLNRRDALIDALIKLAIDRQHSGIDVGHLLDRRMRAVEGDRRLQLRHVGGHKPGDAAPKTEAH